MKYILNKYINLVGYKNLPYAIFNKKNNKVDIIDYNNFTILANADGEIDFSKEKLSPLDKKNIAALLDKKIIKVAKNNKKITKEQEYHLYPNYFKNGLEWSITGNCNYRCKHCFMSCPKAIYPHLSLEKCLNIVSQLKECGIHNVTLTGGEPLIRKDFFIIVDALIDSNIDIRSIITNGSLINKKFILEMKKRNIHPTFQISYDGYKMHDWLRGIDGAEQKALNAFKLLHENGFQTNAGMVIHKKNMNTIIDTLKTLKRYGVSVLKVNRAFPSGEWEKQTKYFLSEEDLYQIGLDFIPKYLKAKMPIDIEFESCFCYYHKQRKGFIPIGANANSCNLLSPICASILYDFYISPTGDCLPCQTMITNKEIIKTAPNLFKTPLKDILTKSTLTALSSYKLIDYLEKNNKCQDCKYLKKCRGGCRSKAIGNICKNFLAIDKINCSFFLNKWYDKFVCVIENFNKQISKN